MLYVCCDKNMFLSTSVASMENIASSIRNGGFELSPVGILESLLNMGFSQVQELARYLVLFMCFGMLTTLISLLGKDMSAQVGSAGFFACYGAVAATAIKCFSICQEYASNTIGDMTEFITKLSPMLATLIITSGKSVTAATFHPVLSAAVYVVSIICYKCVFPLTSYAVVLSVADNLSDQVRISGICKLMNSISKWILALSFTLFTGICAVYGFSAPSLDAVGAKTIKFAVGSLVPVVGGFLAETLETVVSGGRLMKNSVGAAGLVVLCTMCAMPVIKIGAMAIIVRISAAITEPVCDKRISALLMGISRSITTLFAMVATVAVLFLICISILLAATG